MNLTRRETLKCAAAGLAVVAIPSAPSQAEPAPFRLKHILASCLYGYADLKDILPEVVKVGAAAIDLWPKVHGNQREQLDELGEEKFVALLKEHNVRLGCLTQYKLGPFGLADEMRLAKRLGCPTIVTGAVGPKGLAGAELKQAVAKFVEQMKPHVAIAEETGVTIAIENHGANLIDSPDAVKWLVELRTSKHLAIALAPYHLPQNERLLSNLIRDLGDSLAMFYAWQHGAGCMTKLPKEEELLQLPGRGTLDFAPLLAALRDIHFTGWTATFMHPFPRGVPILDTIDAVTAEVNRARSYLDQRLQAP